jgi:hypothetical protein
MQADGLKRRIRRFAFIGHGLNPYFAHLCILDLTFFAPTRWGTRSEVIQRHAICYHIADISMGGEKL